MQEWKEPVMLTFIKLYKEQDCLWNRRNCDKIRRSRATAWCTIAKQINELHKQSVTVMECKQKMKCLVQKFRREKHKVVNGKGENAISDWPLYGALSFLENATFRLLKSPDMAVKPMLRSRRRTRVIQRYPIPVTNGTPRKEREMNITATPIEETKHTAKEPRNTRGKRRVTEDFGRTLRSANIIKLNTTDNGLYSPASVKKQTELKKIKKSSKRPKYLNVNIIHNSTPEVHPRPVTSVGIPLDSRHSLAQDESQCFGMYVANKTRSYSGCTRSAVQHAISEILLKADRGCYDRANSSATVHTQTETEQSNAQPNTMPLTYEVKSEELSDLDDESILH